jgi:putative tricarboxylic transport membrane protein
VLGFFMRRYGFSPAALVIALVLGPLAEESLRQTLLISGGSFDIFVQRGTSLALLCFVVLLLLLSFVGPLVARRFRERLEARTQQRIEERAHAEGPTSGGAAGGDRPTDEGRQVDV